MTNSLYKVTPGQVQQPLASDINQYADTFNGNADVGQFVLAAQISAPSISGITGAAVTGTTLGVGSYRYQFTYVVGIKKSDNTAILGLGETSPSGSVVVTTTTGNQAIKLSGLPTSWPTTAVAMRIYRTAVGGADGTQKLVTTITYANIASTYTDTTADGALGAAVPTVNTTGTSIAGINAMSHAAALNALMHFENSLLTSRGVQGTFTRASAANDLTTFASLGNNVPSYPSGKFGKGVSIWEGTTNLVQNSDFETFTGTATVFSDPLTSGAAWTVQSGSFTYAAGGATSGAAGALITAGNSAWKPLTGSGSQNLALMAQATFTTQTTLTGNGGLIELFQSNGNYYYANIDGTNGKFWIVKYVGGIATNLASVAQTISASTTYTITLSRDVNGVLTAKLYSGSGTGGTLLQTLTSAPDTSLAGGFLIGVGGDTGVVISNASVAAPWADGWTIGGDQRVAWALTGTNPISGSYSLSAVGIGVGAWAQRSQTIAVSSGQKYALSVYANTTNYSGSAPNVFLNPNTGDGQVNANTGIGTSATQRYSTVYTVNAATSITQYGVQLAGNGTAVFDAIQLEQKSYATPYLRNDSTSSSATRAIESLTLPSSLFSASAGTISCWVNINNSNLSNRYAVLFNIYGSGSGIITVFHSASSWYFKIANDAGSNNQVSIGDSVTSTNGFYLFTINWSSSAAKLYINGVLQLTITSPNLPNSIVGSANIGSDGGSACIDGTIDELAIFNRALTDAEVYSLYAATQPIIDVYASDAATLGGNAPSYYVDTVNAQTIGGTKTFSSSALINKVYVGGQTGALGNGVGNPAQVSGFYDNSNNFGWYVAEDFNLWMLGLTNKGASTYGNVAASTNKVGLYGDGNGAVYTSGSAYVPGTTSPTARNTLDNGSTGAATFASTVNAVGGFQWNGTTMAQTRLFNNKLQFWNGTGWQYAMGYGSGQYKGSANTSTSATLLSVTGMGRLVSLQVSTGYSGTFNVVIDGVTVWSNSLNNAAGFAYPGGSTFGGYQTAYVPFDVAYESSLSLTVSGGTGACYMYWVYELV